MRRANLVLVDMFPVCHSQCHGDLHAGFGRHSTIVERWVLFGVEDIGEGDEIVGCLCILREEVIENSIKSSASLHQCIANPYAVHLQDAQRI